MIGQLIGNYRLLRQIGEGGMGTVYEAVHDQIGRKAAIKLLRPDLSQNKELARRFFNEARAVNIIGHSGIVGIFEFGQLKDGAAYIIMEYLEGESLGDRLARLGGRLETADALRVTRQIASALRAAHDKGIVHRDLKPDNVMIVSEPETPGGERAKVLDFGIAKLAQESQAAGENHPLKTRTGVIMGTPLYMAPEQCRGARNVDGQADVYSLGVMLYQSLAGQPPFAGKGTMELVAKHIYEMPPPLGESVPSLSQDVTTLVHNMLAKDPAARPTMDIVIERLGGMGAPKESAAVAALRHRRASTG